MSNFTEQKYYQIGKDTIIGVFLMATGQRERKKLLSYAEFRGNRNNESDLLSYVFFLNQQKEEREQVMPFGLFARYDKETNSELTHLLQNGIEITSVTKDDENFEFEIIDREFYIYDEGTYKVTVLDTISGKTYGFEITLDTTPPTLVLVGVENGGSTKNTVVMKDVSEKPCDLIVTVDGANFDYKLGEEIEKAGRFVVELIDEAGNKTVYIFERVYSLNGASITAIAGLGALVILLIILLIKSRHHYYADKVEETTTKTIVEDDFDDGEDIVIDSDEETDESDENGEN